MWTLTRKALPSQWASKASIDTNTFDNPSALWIPPGLRTAGGLHTLSSSRTSGAVFVYSLETGKTEQVTDGLSDARDASFDKNGKYLYFTASTNAGPSSGWLDMSSIPNRSHAAHT
jgi:tricorn protease